MPVPHRATRESHLGRSIGIALAIKMIALTVLYFMFFVPAAPPTASHLASAVLGLPAAR